LKRFDIISCFEDRKKEFFIKKISCDLGEFEEVFWFQKALKSSLELNQATEKCALPLALKICEDQFFSRTFLKQNFTSFKELSESFFLPQIAI